MGHTPISKKIMVYPKNSFKPLSPKQTRFLVYYSNFMKINFKRPRTYVYTDEQIDMTNSNYVKTVLIQSACKYPFHTLHLDIEAR